MEMFVDVTLLPKLGNLFNMNYEFGAEKYNLYSCYGDGGKHLVRNKDFDLKSSFMFFNPP